MPSTYSPSLRIELIGDGEQAGLWGQTTNRNLGALLEQAISGFLSLDIFNADITLLALNGAVDQARSAAIQFVGTLTANRTATIPSFPKTYVILNDTAGGFAITIKTASGVGFSVSNGQRAMLVCDGTDVYAVQNNDFFGNVTVDGDLDVGNQLTTVDLNVTGDITLTDPLAVTNGGTGTNSATGSGAVVLDANPALTGVPTAPTAAVATNTTQLATTGFVHSVMFVGFIGMYSGSVGSIPTGWALCTGQTVNGHVTPNLQDRFIVGAGNTYTPGATGGSATLSGSTGSTALSINQMPAHTHTTELGSAPVNNGNFWEVYGTNNPPGNVRTTSSAGNGDGHSHPLTSVASLPPYYALCFIMKVVG